MLKQPASLHLWGCPSLDRTEVVGLAKKSKIEKWKREPKFEVRRHNRCNRCGRPPGLYPLFRAVPYLHATVELGGRASRGTKSQLVGGGVLEPRIYS